MQNQLQKAINLAKKTGDRIIVFDSVKSDSPYVVMNLEEYEKLVVGRSEVRGLTEDELLDKINRDIAIWKSEQEQEAGQEQETGWDRMGGRWDRIDNVIGKRAKYYGPEMMDDDIMNTDMIIDESGSKSKRKWTIPESRKEGAEEIIEEDRQYLEEI